MKNWLIWESPYRVSATRWHESFIKMMFKINLEVASDQTAKVRSKERDEAKAFQARRKSWATEQWGKVQNTFWESNLSTQWSEMTSFLSTLCEFLGIPKKKADLLVTQMMSLCELDKHILLPSRHVSACLLMSDSATPWTVAHQAPLFTGSSQQEYRSGVPFPPPRDLLDPEIEPKSPASPALPGGFFTTAPPRKLYIPSSIYSIINRAQLCKLWAGWISCPSLSATALIYWTGYTVIVCSGLEGRTVEKFG